MALTHVATVGLTLSVAACNPFGGGAFRCATTAQCTGGQCEASGWCSFADSSCPSGRRYGEHSGPESNACVGEDQPLPDGPLPDDAPDDAVADMMIDTRPAIPFCDAAGDPRLVGCWEFEDTADDASGDGNHATATNVTYVAGRVGNAVLLQANSLLLVGNRASLEPPHLSVEAWLRPSVAQPASGRWGVIDSDGAYGIFINNAGIQCGLGGTINAAFTFPVDAWTHVACTNDGTTVRLYINGVMHPTTTGGSNLGTGNTNGIVLAGNSPMGDTFLGAVDQFRVFDEARTATQVCEAAMLSTCP